MLRLPFLPILLFAALIFTALSIDTDIFADSPAKNGKIVFRDNGGYLYTINPDGTGKTKLTDTDHTQKLAAMPNGKFVFERHTKGMDEEWFTMNSDASGLTKLTIFDPEWYHYPSWSRDGTKIMAPVSERYGTDKKTLLMNSDGSIQQEFGKLPGSVTYPFSPDGTKAVHGESNFICVLDLNTKLDKCFEFDHKTRANISWSPTGNVLLYEKADPNPPFKYFITTFDMDVGEEKQLMYGAFPYWSPDGSKILFTGYGEDGLGKAAVYIMNSDGTAMKQLPDTNFGKPLLWLDADAKKDTSKKDTSKKDTSKKPETKQTLKKPLPPTMNSKNQPGASNSATVTINELTPECSRSATCANPNTVHIKAGGTVIYKNLTPMPVFINIFLEKRMMDSGLIRTGMTNEYSFDLPGTYTVGIQGTYPTTVVVE